MKTCMTYGIMKKKKKHLQNRTHFLNTLEVVPEEISSKAFKKISTHEHTQCMPLYLSR